MYKLQIINALTHEMIREKTYKKPDLILDLIETGLKGKECLLFDKIVEPIKELMFHIPAIWKMRQRCLKYCSSWNYLTYKQKWQ